MTRPIRPGQPINPTITPASIAAIQGESPNILRGGHGWVIPHPDGRKPDPCGGPMNCRMCHLEYLAMQTTSRVMVMEGWRIAPGDKLLLLGPQHLNPEDADNIGAELKKRFPEVDVTIINGFTGVQVYRHEPDEGLSNS